MQTCPNCGDTAVHFHEETEELYAWWSCDGCLHAWAAERSTDDDELTWYFDDESRSYIWFDDV